MKELFSTLLYSNTINFLLMVVLFIVVFKKINIKDSFRKMREEIKTVVEKSEEEKEISNKELQRTEDELAKLPSELEKIISDAKISAKNISEDILRTGKEELEKINIQAEKSIKFEEKKFNEYLASITSFAAVDLAEQNAISELNDNPNLHNKFIDEAISELDRINL